MNKLLGRLIGGKAYEASVAQAMAAAIKSGDCVWDVGANVGHYTLQFSTQVGPQGIVYAFEPDRRNATALKMATAARSNVRCMTVALSDRDGEVNFARGSDPLGATSAIVAGDGRPGDVDRIRATTGDWLLVRAEATAPNVIKIDVEGHEFQVLRGFDQLLDAPGLRALFIEVHFQALNSSAVSVRPTDIEALLRNKGFTTRWLDLSHLEASRPQ